MKKIIAAFTFFLAFSINANAQDKSGLGNIPNSEKAKKQANELSEYLGLDQSTNKNFAALFEYKFDVLNDPNATEERKAEMRRIVELKIRGTMDGTLMGKLENNADLFTRLVN